MKAQRSLPRHFAGGIDHWVLRWFLVIAALVSAGVGVRSQDIGFTVQGKLSQEGKPATGLYDFYFTLRSGPKGEALAEYLRPAVPIQDGLFATEVHFRPAFFDVFYTANGETQDDGRYLEVAVSSTAIVAASATDRLGGQARPAAPPVGFVTLQPAIRITPAPTAIRAAAAASITPGGLTPSALVGTVLPGTVSGIVAVQAGTKFSIVPAPGPAWLLAGNAGTTASDFLGTTDQRSIEVRVGNARALLITPAGPSPNLVGGYFGNVVTGAVGVVIGGGGSAGNINLAGANYAFIGGGMSNTASGVAAIVAGGLGNSATNGYSVVSGGTQNFASGFVSVIAGGSLNQAAKEHATVGGGRQNVADGVASTVSGGQDNAAHFDQSTVGGGGGNLAAGSGATTSGGVGNRAELDLSTVSGGGENLAQQFGATVGGGVGNQARAAHATVAGGNANFATGPYSSIPGGAQALADQHGQMAQSAGDFSSPGDAQTSVFVLRGQTSIVNPSTSLSLNGLGLSLGIEVGRTRTFEILVAGRSAGVPPNFSLSGGYAVRGVIKNVGGTTRFVGTPTVTELGEDDPAWSVQVTAGPGSLVIGVHSAATPDVVRWVARLQTAEVAW